MGKIVQLSKNVINQIAAGEVIERPFSVVKELVENSIDAGATKISVEVGNECRDLRIADNGSGIAPSDIELAFVKHATSKIKTEDDLFNIHTLGFRGEALASIISISKLTCITRTKDFDYGLKVSCKNSEISKTETGCAIGTIMDIKDLFYNIPVRLKFLKSAKTEFAYINELMQSIALIHPDISFELKFNGKTYLKTISQKDNLQTVKSIFSDELTSNLKPVYKTDGISNLVISGYISTPDYTRATKKDYYTYVNKRPVKCPIYQKAIDTAYKNLLGNSRFPFIVLNLEIPTEDVDINVHPTKKEVRYRNPNQIFNFIYSAVDETLKKAARYNFQETSSNIVSLPNNENKPTEDIYVQTGENIENKFRTLIEQKENENENKDFLKKTDVTTQKVIFTEQFAKNNNISKPLAFSQNQNNNKNNIFNDIETKSEDIIIGQYKKTYIIIEKENGLEIVDQHIADERYIYETLKKTKNIDCQLLFLSDVLEISPSDKTLLETNKDKLEKYGYEIDFISEGELIFRKIPQILSKISPKEILADILENISGNINNIEESILITTSCKAAVKANTYLNQYQMEEIIKNWRTCENPETCPHGRVISKFFEHKEIAKFFQRNK